MADYDENKKRNVPPESFLIDERGRSSSDRKVFASARVNFIDDERRRMTLTVELKFVASSETIIH
jgi:hypothetical protein